MKTFNEEKPKQKDKPDLPDLAGLLQRERMRLKRKARNRYTSHYFSPSTLTFGFCHRKKVAQLAGITSIKRDAPTPKEELRMDVGKHYHTILQRYFWKTGLLEGEWSCRTCKATDSKALNWWAVSPTECKNGHKDLKFEEVPLENEVYRIRGRADGIVHVEWQKQKQRHLLEIKSIQNRAATSNERQVCFEDLTEPKPDHLVQGQFYLMMSKLQQGHIFYVSTNTNQIKSFYFEYDISVIAPYLNDIRIICEWAQDIKARLRFDLPDPCDRKSCDCEEVVYPRVNVRTKETAHGGHFISRTRPKEGVSRVQEGTSSSGVRIRRAVLDMPDKAQPRRKDGNSSQ